MSENRLGAETSPYLLQHKDNPVHWRAWGPEALAEAKATGKPILLSVGYAACHWCHVMAHESFEDEATARVMNALFVNIKVDREERPDVDAIYMGALHRLGQQGGWPLTMFLDSGARPFWGGTYFPKTSQWGRPAFVDVLAKIAAVYRDDAAAVAGNAAAIMESLSTPASPGAGPEITDALLRDLTRRMVRAVDPVHGGLAGAPKFPQWSFFWLLWRGAIRYGSDDAVTAVETTLTNICQGGIYDHLAGGFARYSVDERWLAPHFEKMLYDNALLIDLLTEVWRETQKPLYRARVAETVDWLLSEMVAEGGGFAASLDADSEGEEGKFYVWTAAGIADVLGAEDADFFGRVYDVSADGNWEGHTILGNRLRHMEMLSDAEEARLAAMRGKLLAARAQRIRPGWDDKVLADWNGLAIAALARAARVFDRPAWMTAAERAFTFVASSMSAGGGRLRHSYRAGKAGAPATSSDYANMILAALRLFQATGTASYLDAARGWTAVLETHYRVEGGAYALTADDTDDIIVRLAPGSDDATPNANAIMVSNLAALALLTNDETYGQRGREIVAAFAGALAQAPLGYAGLLAGALDLMAPQLIVVLEAEGAGPSELAAELSRVSLPGALELVAAGSGAPVDTPALAGKGLVDGASTAYACIGPRCSAPVTDRGTFRQLLVADRAAK